MVKYIVRHSRRMILLDRMTEYENGQIFYDRASLYDYVTSRSEFRAVFRPLSQESFDWAVQVAIALGNVTLVIDEVDQYASTAFMSQALYWAVHYGRHYNVSLVIASRMANRIRTDITAQADLILSFQMQGRSTLAYIDSFADYESITLVKSLESHNFIPVVGRFAVDVLSRLP